MKKLWTKWKSDLRYFLAQVRFYLLVRPRLTLINPSEIHIDPRVRFRSPGLTTLDASRGEICLYNGADLGACTLMGPAAIFGTVKSGCHQTTPIFDLYLPKDLLLDKQGGLGFLLLTEGAEKAPNIFLSEDEGAFYMPDNQDALVEYLRIRGLEEHFLTRVSELREWPVARAKLLESVKLKSVL